MPTDAAGVYAAYAPGIDYAAEQGLLTYVPIFHPWSIYRISDRAAQIELLLDHAGKKQQIASCTQIYQHLCAHRALAPAHPPE